MSFQINFYTNTSEKNKVDKTLVSAGSMWGNLKDQTSIIDPVILVEDFSVFDANYAEISAFNRKYFITDIKTVRNGLWEISMHVDVLSTYKNAIRQNGGIIARQANDYNNYIDDPKLPCLNKTQTQTLLLNNAHSFNTSSNVILLNAGAANKGD